MIHHMDGMKIPFYGVRDALIRRVLKMTGNKSGKAIVRGVNLEAERVIVLRRDESHEKEFLKEEELWKTHGNTSLANIP